MIPFLYLIMADLSDIKPLGLPKSGTDSDQISTVLSIVFAIVGALALLMLIISGLRYILSSGDSGNIAKAKDGIIYSLIGLMVALTAEAIVAFAVRQL